MTDLALRRRERAASGGDLEARARLLAERLRHGAVARERLRLAAYAGDAAAAVVLGAEPAAPEALAAWARGLLVFGDEACARAALGLADLTLPVWEGWEPGVFAPGAVLRRARTTTQALLLVRDEASWARADGALLAAEEALERTRHHLATLEGDHPGLVRTSAWRAVDAAWAALCAVRAALDHLRGPEGRAAMRPARDLGWAVRELEPGVVAEHEALAALRSAVRVWAAVG